MKNDLIFDLGFHDGSDSRFYLGKGFKVVALEANPTLVEKGQQVFRNEIERGQLTIVNRALTAQKDSGPVSFYVNMDKDDWSSTSKTWAEKGGHHVQHITVQSTTTEDLIAEFGHPYYIKCDIEGEDKTFINQISSAKNKPKYLSVEGGGALYINTLKLAGYSKFQVVNQLLHFRKSAPKPPREGEYFGIKFTNVMSGLFGRELPDDRWWSGEKTIDVIEQFKALRAVDLEIAPGWIDLHAMLSDNESDA